MTLCKNCKYYYEKYNECTHLCMRQKVWSAAEADYNYEAFTVPTDDFGCTLGRINESN